MPGWQTAAMDNNEDMTQNDEVMHEAAKELIDAGVPYCHTLEY